MVNEPLAAPPAPRSGIRRRVPYVLTLAVGAAIGYLYGCTAFPVIGHIVGDPLCDLIMAVGGAALAGIGYEIVASFATRD